MENILLNVIFFNAIDGGGAKVEWIILIQSTLKICKCLWLECKNCSGIECAAYTYLYTVRQLTLNG